MAREATASAAYGAHRPRRLAEARLAHVVLELLAPDGVADQLLEPSIRRTIAQRLPQVGLVQREQAGSELAFRRQPDAVAVRTEGLGHRVHEADLAAPVGEAEHARGGRRLAWDLLEWVDRVDDPPHLLAREHG